MDTFLSFLESSSAQSNAVTALGSDSSNALEYLTKMLDTIPKKELVCQIYRLSPNLALVAYLAELGSLPRER